MQGIFYELITEACIGKVIIDDDIWPIAFNTIIEDNYEKKEKYNENNLSTLMIKNKDNFLKLLEKYIVIELEINRPTIKFYKNPYKNKIKWLMSYLFVNASLEDFNNPEEFIKRRIDFLEDNHFSFLNNGITLPFSDTLENSNLYIKKNISPVGMETPYKIDLSLIKRNSKDTYNLPSIYYGISNNTCYIYSMLTPKEEKKSLIKGLYNKKMNRLLYKVNDKVEKEEDLINYEKGIGEYPEDNITDVTHSFIFALNIFISLLEKENIEDIKVVPYLPLRYLSRELASLQQKDEVKKEEYHKRNDTIQTNLTNKLIRTFRRVAHQNKNIEITTYPYEVDEYLTIKVHKKGIDLTNPLLKETTELIERGIKK